MDLGWFRCLHSSQKAKVSDFFLRWPTIKKPFITRTSCTRSLTRCPNSYSKDYTISSSSTLRQMLLYSTAFMKLSNSLWRKNSPIDENRTDASPKTSSSNFGLKSSKASLCYRRSEFVTEMCVHATSLWCMWIYLAKKKTSKMKMKLQLWISVSELVGILQFICPLSRDVMGRRVCSKWLIEITVIWRVWKWYLLLVSLSWWILRMQMG